ncbi:hypothetical protein B0T25DRAFT_432065, partial [Lasiosphaeria hispida]
GVASETAGHDLSEQLAQANKEITEQKLLIARLRNQKTELAASRTPSDPLVRTRVPEAEIVKDWHALKFLVKNFAVYFCHEDRRSEKTRQIWAASESSEILKRIHPDFLHFAAEKQSLVWLVEAAIWSLLMNMVFSDSNTNNGAQWAGIYARRLNQLSIVLFKGIQPADYERQKDFHHWKALTTGLISNLDRKITNREDAVVEITDELADFFEPFPATKDGDTVWGYMQEIVHKAITLDEVLCGQEAWYRLKYPPDMIESRADSKTVCYAEPNMAGDLEKRGMIPYIFVVSPLLHRSGGRRGESYGDGDTLD